LSELFDKDVFDGYLFVPYCSPTQQDTQF